MIIIKIKLQPSPTQWGLLERHLFILWVNFKDFLWKTLLCYTWLILCSAILSGLPLSGCSLNLTIRSSVKTGIGPVRRLFSFSPVFLFPALKSISLLHPCLINQYTVVPPIWQWYATRISICKCGMCFMKYCGKWLLEHLIQRTWRQMSSAFNKLKVCFSKHLLMKS